MDVPCQKLNRTVLADKQNHVVSDEKYSEVCYQLRIHTSP